MKFNITKYPLVSSPFLLGLTLCLMLSGCAMLTKTDYEKASSYGEIGFSHKKLAYDKYRIMFAGEADVKPGEAVEYAIQHAAQLTLEKGYDWFEVLESDSEVETSLKTKIGPNQDAGSINPSTCGEVGCAISDVTKPDTGEQVTEAVAEEVKSFLLIKMGRGNVPQHDKVFDANSVLRSLSTQKNVQ